MAIITQDGYEFYEGLNGHKIFILKGLNLKEELSYIKNKNILSIALGDLLQNGIIDLSFLKEINFIEEIHTGDTLLDYSGIYYLNSLKRVTVNIEKAKPNLDFSKFQNLEYLSIDWYEKFPDLSNNLKLKELYIWKFRPKSQTFKDVVLPQNIEFLHITESNILNLDGLECSSLKTFEGHNCSKLESLSGIKGISNIETLILDYCVRLTQYNDLKNCEQLRKIILGNCGTLPTLNWLKSLKNVNYFSFWGTKLESGDTSPCFGIDYVSFKNSKDYNHKSEEFGVNFLNKTKNGKDRTV